MLFENEFGILEYAFLSIPVFPVIQSKKTLKLLCN